MSVEMYASGDSVVAGLVPATSRRCCGRVSICEISVSASAFLAHADLADSSETGIGKICVICVRTCTALTLIALMCGKNAIMNFTQTAQVLHPQNRRNRREK